MSDVSSLAAMIQKVATPAAPPATVSQGVIVNYHSATSPPTVDINLAGSATLISGVQFMPPYVPTPGDVVQVVQQSNGLMVMGTLLQTPYPAPSPATIGAWTTPGFFFGGVSNGGGGGGPVQYRRVVDANGIEKVEVKGSLTLTGGVNGWNLFTYTPAVAAGFFRVGLAISNVGVCYIQFDSSGNTTLQGIGSTSATALLMDGINFFTQ